MFAGSDRPRQEGIRHGKISILEKGGRRYERKEYESFRPETRWKILKPANGSKRMTFQSRGNQGASMLVIPDEDFSGTRSIGDNSEVLRDDKDRAFARVWEEKTGGKSLDSFPKGRTSSA